MTTPVPFGPEKRVNTTINEDQAGGAVTRLADGGWVVAWIAGFSLSQVQFQAYNADGTRRGGETTLDIDSAKGHSVLQVAALSDGGWVLAWTEFDPLVQNSGEVWSQSFNRDGTQQTDPIQVNTVTVGTQEYSSVTPLKNGGFFVTWTDRGPVSYIDDEVRGRLFDSGGHPISDEFSINTSVVAGNQDAPQATLLEGGNIVVSWFSYEDVEGTEHGVVRFRLFSPSGVPIGAEQRISTAKELNDSGATVCALQGGEFAIAWTRNNTVGNPERNVFVQVFSANGDPQSLVKQVNVTTVWDQGATDIVGLADGGFLVAWDDSAHAFDGDPIGDEIMGRAFNADGTPRGDEFSLDATNSGYQQGASLASLPDGRVVVTWTDLTETFGGSANDVHSQIWDPRVAGMKLTGTKKADVWVGSAFADRFDGSSGNDILTGEKGNDTLIGGKGEDTLSGGDGADSVTGGDGDDVLSGNSGNDDLDGGKGKDALLGGAGNDKLNGGSDKDTIDGGAGKDKLTGSLGNDKFRFMSVSEGGDTIVDFHSASGDNDAIEISASGFGSGLVAHKALSAAQFQTRADNLAQDANDRFIFRTTDATLWFDKDGKGGAAALMVADLQNSAMVTHSDIFII